MPNELYKNIKLPSIGTHSPVEITLSELAEWDFPDMDGAMSNYAVLLVRACIDSICRGNTRKEPMPSDERTLTAESVVRNYSHWRAWELKDFEDKLANGFIGVKNTMGLVDYELRAIDRGSLLQRFKAYDAMRRPSDRETLVQPEPGVPVRPLTDWHRTHLLDHSEHRFSSEAECEQYWRGLPDSNDPRDAEAINAIINKYKKLKFKSL